MRASHKESGRMGVRRGSICKGQVQDRSWQKLRHERLSGRTSENTGGEWRLCTFYELFSQYLFSKYVLSTCHMHGTVLGMPIQQEQSRCDPCLLKAFILEQQILQRGIPSSKQTQFQFCCMLPSCPLRGLFSPFRAHLLTGLADSSKLFLD